MAQIVEMLYVTTYSKQRSDHQLLTSNVFISARVAFLFEQRLLGLGRYMCNDVTEISAIVSCKIDSEIYLNYSLTSLSIIFRTFILALMPVSAFAHNCLRHNLSCSGSSGCAPGGRRYDLAQVPASIVLPTLQFSLATTPAQFKTVQYHTIF